MSMTYPTTAITRAAIEHALRMYIVENFFVEEVLEATSSLTDAGVIDSTGVLELVAWIEDTYSIEIPDDDILPDNLDSIASIVGYVAGVLGA